MAVLSKNGTEIKRFINPSRTKQFSFRKMALKSGTLKYFILKKTKYPTDNGNVWGNWTHHLAAEKWVNQGIRTIDDVMNKLNWTEI